jgi:hypothetical protein
VSAAKDAATIARDISARFLPEYRARLAAALARVAGEDEYEAKCTANLKRLQSVLGDEKPLGDWEKREKRVSVRVGEVYGHVQVYAESVNIELRALTVAQAEQVLNALRA